MKYNKKIIVMAAISMLASSLVSAETVLDSAILTNLKIDNLNLGKTELDKVDIENRTGLDNDLNVLFKFLSNIQFITDNSKSTETSTLSRLEPHLDQRPAEFSISGGKGYENQFVIGGVGGRSKLSPPTRNIVDSSAGGVFNSANHPANSDIAEAARSPQNIWVDNKMVDKVTVLDSVIPVKYSNFSGGVVDVELKKASNVKSGSVYANYGSSDMNWYTVHQEKLSSSVPKKPKFTDYSYGANYNIPVSRKANMLVGFSGSDIVEKNSSNHARLSTSYTDQSHMKKYSMILNSSNTNSVKWDISLLAHKYTYQSYLPSDVYPEFNKDSNDALQVSVSTEKKIGDGLFKINLSQNNNTLQNKSNQNDYIKPK